MSLFAFPSPKKNNERNVEGEKEGESSKSQRAAGRRRQPLEILHPSQRVVQLEDSLESSSRCQASSHLHIKSDYNIFCMVMREI